MIDGGERCPLNSGGTKTLSQKLTRLISCKEDILHPDRGEDLGGRII